MIRYVPVGIAVSPYTFLDFIYCSVIDYVKPLSVSSSVSQKY
nr:MAG TPA: hypothetical protein [Caudoviricetes sp.]